MQRLNELAQLDMKESDGSQECHLAIAHVGHVKKLAKAILNKTFSTHVHRTAFDGIDFGANPHGILGATMDDHLHSCEAGIMMNLAEVACHGLTAKELTEIEKIIWVKVMSGRSSANDDYPRSTVKSGFGKLTLCSHKEKVGIVFYLLLALHDKHGREIIEKANERQKNKYLTFPSKSVVMSISKEASLTKKRTANQGTSSSDGDSKRDSNSTSQLPASAFPYRKDLIVGIDHVNRYPFPQDNQSIEFVCRHLRMHGFGFLLDTFLDAFQLDHLMITSWGILCPLKKPSNPYPTKDALWTICSNTEVINAIVNEDEEDDDDDEPTQSSVEETCKVILPHDLPSREIDTNNAKSSDNEQVKHQQLLTIFGCIPKHRRKKPVVKGSGYTKQSANRSPGRL